MTCIRIPVQILTVFLTLLGIVTLHAATPNIPPAFSFSAELSGPPQVQKPLQLTASLKSLAGTLKDIRVVVDLPEGWTPVAPAKLDKLGANADHEFTWTLTPTQGTLNGSILLRVTVTTPKEDLIRVCRDLYPEQAEEMAQSIRSWPAETKATADVAFSLTEDEGFYPLTGEAWHHYDERLKPAGARKGVVYHKDPLLSAFQAQTDVDMFEQLQTMLTTDPELEKKLLSSGIPLQKKTSDYLYGLFAMATEQYEKGDFKAAQNFLERFSAAANKWNPASNAGLKVAAGNIRALTIWALGDERAAKKCFQDTFYQDRKHPLQRYILRNLGLLMLDSRDPATAKEMLRLALQLKPEYTLVQMEFEALNGK